MGLLVGGLGVAVVALAVVVIVLASDSSEDSPTTAGAASAPGTGIVQEDATPAAGDPDEDCGVVESGGPAKLDLSLSGLECEEGRAVQLALVEKADAGAGGVVEVGEWRCVQEPLAVYPLLTRCRSSDGRQLDVVGTAPHAHLTPAEEQAAEPQAPRPVYFELPSGNVTCALSAESATCEIARKSYTPSVPKPPSCPLDYGHRLSVSADGTASFVCHGDSMQGIANGATLPYGNVIRRGRISCLSQEDGLTCRAGTGAGFFLSSQRAALL